MGFTRRTFVKNISIASFTPFLPNPLKIPFQSPGKELEISIFSKHLQFLDCASAGEVAAELGFNGIDLTVRPKGHIAPENAPSELPKAVKDIRSAGSDCKIITSAISSASNSTDGALIKTAAQSGIKIYRSNWYKYKPDISMQESLQIYREEIRNLAELNKLHGIVGCYQNHSGKGIGSSYWEIYQLLEGCNPEYFGTQYDIRHAMVEGGFSWENGLKLLHKSIKIIALKDYKWTKSNGKWELYNVPIGEGMVDFVKYFQLLKAYGLSPPATLHLEYPLGGAEHGRDSISVDKKVVFDAMKNDLVSIQNIWKSV